ncbi:MAG TPA: hypothetical protein VKG45_03775 [Actinomycetes bacterium]|nr:hypothetical protein [Actinomycetes bacterium]
MSDPFPPPGLDQKPLPCWSPTRHVEYCPTCTEPGVLFTFALPGWPPQVHVVHRVCWCPRCGEEHPVRVCPQPTWPPIPGPHVRVVVVCPAPQDPDAERPAPLDD